MEQILTAPKYDWRTIEMYDDEGKRITNERTLRSMAEAMELADEWERSIERRGIGKIMRRYYEGEDELDSAEEA